MMMPVWALICWRRKGPAAENRSERSSGARRNRRASTCARSLACKATIVALRRLRNSHGQCAHLQARIWVKSVVHRVVLRAARSGSEAASLRFGALPIRYKCGTVSAR